MIRAISPGLAMWSMPVMPNMSPAAMGCSMVRFRGCCSRSKRSPSAFSTASGQFSPEEELTATTASSGMTCAASAAETIFGICHLLPRIRSAAFSAMAMVGALVLEDTISGMIELSQTRNPEMPRTRSCVSTTAIASRPILQVPTGW